MLVIIMLGFKTSALGNMENTHGSIIPTGREHLVVLLSIGLDLYGPSLIYEDGVQINESQLKEMIRCLDSNQEYVAM